MLEMQIFQVFRLRMPDLTGDLRFLVSMPESSPGTLSEVTWLELVFGLVPMVSRSFPTAGGPWHQCKAEASEGT